MAETSMTTRFFRTPADAYKAWKEDETQVVFHDDGDRYAVGYWPMIGADVDQDADWWEVDDPLFLDPDVSEYR